MWVPLTALLSLPAAAETLPIPLGTQTATVSTPSGKEVSFSFRGGGENQSGTWKNIESSTFSVRCSAEPLVPTEAPIDQVVLQVGDKKWALAAGSSVAFACGAGKTVTVTDLAKRAVATATTSLTMTVEGIR